MGAAKDYWALGIAPGSDQKSIKEAFRKEAMKWHPDKWANAPASAQESAASRYQNIQDAYKRLSSEAQQQEQQGWQAGAHSGYNKHDFMHEQQERSARFTYALYGGALLFGGYYLFAKNPLDSYDEKLHEQIIAGRDLRNASQPKKHAAEKIKVDSLMDGPYTDQLRSMSMQTGAKPIRTGYGWDWTPVKKAYDEGRTVKKAGAEYIEEELAGPAWEKELQKKIDKIKRKKARRRERKEKEAAHKARAQDLDELTTRFTELEQRLELQQRENVELRAKLDAVKKK